jgi:hypothetical protein
MAMAFRHFEARCRATADSAAIRSRRYVDTDYAAATPQPSLIRRRRR